MPKIDAPTVAEHHAKQRASVIAAARHALGTGGIAGVTPGAVAKTTGLARTSIYQYFPSTGALLTVAIEDMFQDAGRRIDAELQGSTDPWQRICAYVSVALRAAAGEYGPFHSLPHDDLPPSTRARLRELHDKLAAPLTDAVREFDITSPEMTTALILGCIGSGITMARQGRDVAQVTEATCAFIAGGLRP